MDGTELPHLLIPLPGPGSQALIDRLALHECPAITARRARRAAALGVASTDPVVWRAAVGANVEDTDGNRFVDLTSGFGVALIGHRDPGVVAAVRAQSERLLHAMGDAWPDEARVRLLDRLAQAAPPGLEVGLLGLSGSDAIDAAVKTAVLSTGRRGVLVFEGAYHGLALGVLGLQAYKADFTEPFRAITHPAVRVLPFGAPMAAVREALTDGDVGLVLVEPVQGRGGMRAPPAGWLAELAAETRRSGALFAVDEIQSGLGRTGDAWAVDAEGVVPDLLCAGKALGGGFPLSVCLGSRPVMDAWGASKGEAIHTQTFLGHPVGCAAGLAVLEQVDTPAFRAQVRDRSARLRGVIEAQGVSVRGRGLMLGAELGPKSYAISRRLLDRGFISLPAGLAGEVLGLTPPATLTDAQIDAFGGALLAARAEVA